MKSAEPERPERRAAAGRRYQPLHSAGLLVEVVRTLTTSPSQTQKELVKEKLEKDYLATEQAVDSLVDAQQHDVSAALQSFRRVAADVQSARERIKMIKNNLSSCQLLLRCKRDELKKLWLESAELKHVARLLDELDLVKAAQQQIAKHIAEGRLLRAAEAWTSSNAVLEGLLKDVDGLRELRQTYAQLKRQLVGAIMQQIYNELYVRPSGEVLKDARRARLLPLEDEQPDDGGGGGGFSSGGAEYASIMDEVPMIGDNGCALEELQCDTMTAVQRLAVVSDALALLDCLEQASTTVLQEMDDHLWQVLVYRTSRFICEHLHGSSGVSGEAWSVAELLRLLFIQLRFVTSVFGVLINQFNRALQCRRGQRVSADLSMTTVWDRVQQTLERLLRMYLDVKQKNTAAVQQQQEETEDEVVVVDGKSGATANNISCYFQKKAPALPKRRLFSFDSTAFSQAYENERKGSGCGAMMAADGGGGGQVVCICRPGAQNIKAAFRLLVRFIGQVESRSAVAPCRLRTFVNNYIRTSFLPTLRRDLVHKAGSLLSGRGDAWTRTAATAEDQAAALNLHVDLPHSTVPLLFSTLRTLDCCRDVEMVLATAPAFCSEFFQLWLHIANLYLASAGAQYSHLTCSPTPTSAAASTVVDASPKARTTTQKRRKISAAWATDPDISRLLRSLPNWQNLPAAEAPPAAGTPSSPALPPAAAVAAASADGVRSRNARESEILIGNLGSQSCIEEAELIVSDSRRLQLLACFQESTEYFWRSAKSTLASLPSQVRSKLLKVAAGSLLVTGDQSAAGDQMTLSNNDTHCRPTEAPQSLMDEFVDCLNCIEQLSSTCLLMLHLEVRVHCFYHLLPLIRQPMFMGSSEEVDDQVIRLNKDLIQLNSLLSGSLQAAKLRYIFEGLGHLISTIFISGCQHIVRISDTGKKRICRDIFSVQQCLSGLTGSRETDLDHARRFYELLFKTPDDILNSIVEGGADYSIGDYTNLLALAIRSHPLLNSEPGALEARLQRLRSVVVVDKTQC